MLMLAVNYHILTTDIVSSLATFGVSFRKKFPDFYCWQELIAFFQLANMLCEVTCRGGAALRMFQAERKNNASLKGP